MLRNRMSHFSGNEQAMTNKTITERSDNKVIATIPYIKGTSERIARILRPTQHYGRPQTFDQSSGCAHEDKRSIAYQFTNRSSLQTTVRRMPC